MRCFVIMGVAGCGKTSVGEALAKAGAVSYRDGDDLHPPENIAKMSKGIPLTDADREPWLARIGAMLATTSGPCAVGCSALKRKYRRSITEQAGEPVGFLHLSAPKEVILQRMTDREGHFMPVSLIDSQFADLEPLGSDELGCALDITVPLEEVVSAARAFLRTGF